MLNVVNVAIGFVINKGEKMSETQTVKCPLCHEPYKTYAYYVGDQSACPDCVSKAEQKEGGRGHGSFGEVGL